jgi:glycosyltransferase involved in cell wall biosynthesis
MKKENQLISVIIIFYEKYEHDEVRKLYSAYKTAIQNITNNFEFVFVVNGNMKEVYSEIKMLSDEEEKIKLIRLAKWFGDATALQVGFENSSGSLIITLPSFQQVPESDIPKLVLEMDDVDMTIGWRHPRLDSAMNRLQARIFHRIIKLFMGFNFHDLKCVVKVMKREVLEKIYMYGDQDRFLPLLAERYGFKIKEIKVRQLKKDPVQKFYPFENYVQRVLELVSIFFLVKFTKRPLRFFGSLGLLIFAVGFVLGIVLMFEKFYFGEPLAERPLLLLSILFMVFGFQSFAIGLVGELIIFTHAKDLKDYIVEKIVGSKDKEETFIES